MTHPLDDALLLELEAFYDAVPRHRARAEIIGGLVLFTPEGGGYPLYARPALHASASPTEADLAAARARQRALGLPESFEWVHEVTPALLPLAEAAGLAVLRAPMMLLEALATHPVPTSVQVTLLDPAREGFAAELAAHRAVAHVGFSQAGPEVAEAGIIERDALIEPLSAEALAREATHITAGHAACALARTPTLGALASGAYQRAGDVVEIVGVATLPAFRRRGLGAAITAALARHALSEGALRVFISAGSDTTARMYAALGFRRVGTACIATPKVDPDGPRKVAAGGTAPGYPDLTG